MTGYQSGNTVRFNAEFYDFDGQLIDPAVIRFIVYDNRWAKLSETSIGAADRKEVGKYFYDYITITSGIFYFEWYAEINSYPSLKRGQFTISKI